MPPLPTPRGGEKLRVRSRPLDFGYWTMGRTTRRYGLQTPLYCSDPWPLLAERVRVGCPSPQRAAAMACLEQARDLYTAAVARPVSAAKPLILYYCYLNLAKTQVLALDQRRVLDRARHGVAERLGPGEVELTDAYLDAFPSTSSSVNMFHEFVRAVSGTGLAANTRYELPRLLPQIVPGHRLWAAASDLNGERFLGVERFEFLQDKQAKEIWLRMYVFADGLATLNLTHAAFLSQSGLAPAWREVKCADAIGGRKLVCFEHAAGHSYSSRPSDEVPNLVGSVRQHLWVTALMYAPWRRYYLYAAPPSDRASVLPQLASVYAVTFYLGSIARYRPHHFQGILEGPYGPWVQSFLNEQPTQFLFLLASDIARQDVLKAAIA